METHSSLRRLGRRSLACLAFGCFTFLACAFYSFTLDAYDAVPFKPATFAAAPTAGSSFEVREPGGHDAPDKPVYDEHVHDERVYNERVHDERVYNELVLDERVYGDGRTGRELVHHDLADGGDRVHGQSKRDGPAETRYVYLADASPSTSSTTASPPTNVQDTCSRNATRSPKLILLWTPFFGHWGYLSESGVRQCDQCRNCRITRDRSKLLESDAVIFHARDLSVADLPPVRLPRQRWVFYCLESPPYSDFPGLGYAMDMFNWTMTYRLDSDIKATYGTVYRVRPPRKPDLEYLEWSWSNKSRSVAWLTSHCPTHGGRDAYARELGKYIDVDVFGKCGSSECPPGQTELCLQGFAEKYKFFLAFENTLCKDYVTEKFYRTLGYDIVPVVFGGANYSKVAPPGSYVDALAFRSPRHLAFFLKGVGRNFKLYSSYFRWRRDYDVQLGNGKECQLCSLLHRKDVGPSSYADLRAWWVRGSRCNAWKAE